MSVYICIYLYVFVYICKCLCIFFTSIYLPRLHPWEDPFHTEVAAQIKQTKTHILMNIKQQRVLRKEIALEVFTLALQIFQRKLQSFGKGKSQKLSTYSSPLLRCWEIFLPWSGEGKVFVKEIFVSIYFYDLFQLVKFTFSNLLI